MQTIYRLEQEYCRITPNEFNVKKKSFNIPK